MRTVFATDDDAGIRGRKFLGNRRNVDCNAGMTMQYRTGDYRYMERPGIPTESPRR